MAGTLAPELANILTNTQNEELDDLRTLIVPIPKELSKYDFSHTFLVSQNNIAGIRASF